MKTKVTVIIPVYNISNEILLRCISSVENQSLKDIKIIIIDDGSNRQCADLCDKLGSGDKRITVYHKENDGVSTCRNYGIENSDTEWIAFVDADDWIEPDYLEKLVEASEKSEADITLCDCFIEYEHKSVRNAFFIEKTLDSNRCGKDRFTLQFLCSKINGDSCSATDSGAPWAKLYRREFIVKNRLKFRKELRRMQDNIFNLEAYEYASKIFYFAEPLYHYRKSNDSGFNKYNPSISDNYIMVFRYIKNYIQEYKKNNDFIKALNYKVIFSMYVILKNDFCHPDNMTSYREQKHKLERILQNEYYRNAMKKVDKKILSRTERLLLILMRLKALGLMKLSLHCKNILYKCMGRGI